MWEVSCLSEDLLVPEAALLHDIALIQQCRLLDGRKQFLAELTAVPSYYRICSSVPSVNIPLSSPLYSSSQLSPLQAALLRHIKPISLSVPRSYKHRPSSLHQSPTVTSPTLHCEGLRSTPSNFMYKSWCSNSSTNCLQRTGHNFTSHLLCLCVSAVSSC